MIVFPANAGMIPATEQLEESKLGVPRECGDDPRAKLPDHANGKCSPRMRG